MQEKRVDWIDFCKGIAIILVVLGHCIWRMGDSRIESLMNLLICSFHMPLFFFLSGINLKLQGDEKTFFRKRVKKILIPTVIFSALLLLFKMIRTFDLEQMRVFIQNQFHGKSLYYLLCFTRKSIVSEYWFLPALFMSQILIFYLVKYCKKTLSAIVISFVMFGLALLEKCIWNVALPLSVEVSFLTFNFLVIAYWANVKKDIMHMEVKKVLFGISTLVFLTGNAVVAKLDLGSVDVYGLQVRNVILFFVNAYSGIFMMISISKWIGKISFINYLGRKSLYVYGIHYFLLELFVWIHKEMNLGAHMKGLAFLYAGVIVAICYVICKIGEDRKSDTKI